MKTTKKEVNNSFKNVICVSYCGLQNLLDRFNKNAFTCGVYGWNADIYFIDNSTAIVTGYRPFGNIRPSFELVNKFDKAAEKITSNYLKPYEEIKKELDNLLTDFVSECIH